MIICRYADRLIVEGFRREISAMEWFFPYRLAGGKQISFSAKRLKIVFGGKSTLRERFLC